MIIQSTIFFICILIFILTFYTTKLSIPFFEKFFQDIPNIRSSHKKTKPTGLGIIFAIFSSIAFLILAIFLCIYIYWDCKYNKFHGWY